MADTGPKACAGPAPEMFTEEVWGMVPIHHAIRRQISATGQAAIPLGIQPGRWCGSREIAAQLPPLAVPGPSLTRLRGTPGAAPPAANQRKQPELPALRSVEARATIRAARTVPRSCLMGP